MNVDYDLYEGETASASVRHTFSRGTLVYDRGEILTEPGHGRFVAAVADAASGREHVTALRLDPAAVIADLDELAEPRAAAGSPAPSGSRGPRSGWRRAPGCAAKLEQIGLSRGSTSPGTCGPPIDGESDAFLIVGSHIDAVPDGGWLDGALGLLTALEVGAAAGARAARRLPIGVRFVDWADEEGARFARSLLGSSACAGTLVPDDVRTLTDADGVTLGDALAACGVDLDRAVGATTSLEGAVAYLELHIEQGPVLLDTGRLAAAVSGTFGVERHLMIFTGQAAHAGSTPMRLRQDSLAAAARAALEIRESAIAHGGVGTVGQDGLDAGRDHGRRRADRDAARPAPSRPGRARCDVQRSAWQLPARPRSVRLHARGAQRVRGDADAVPPGAREDRAGGGRRRRRRRRRARSRAGRCTTPPRSAASFRRR